MRRRAVLTVLPAAGLAASGPLTAQVDAALAELSPIPRRVGAEEVAQVRALTAQAFDVTQRFGGGGAREMLGGQLRWAVGLLDAHIDPSAYRPLHSEVGSLARCAGWVSHDMGVYAAANRCCEVALHCADQADDWSLRGKSLRDLSRITEYLGDGAAALTLAQQAQVRADRITPLERACLSQAEAAAYGRRGDLEACLAAIGRTEDHLAAADPANESPAMIAYYSPAEHAEGIGAALWPLAMQGHAVAETAARLRFAADTHGPDRVCARTLGLTRLATLLFAHSDPEEAIAVANAALNEAPMAQSRRHADDLITLRRAARRHRGLPGVPDLHHRLNRALSNV